MLNKFEKIREVVQCFSKEVNIIKEEKDIEKEEIKHYAHGSSKYLIFNEL